MSDVRLDVLAIGTLAENRFWNETGPAREEFSTVTLVRSGKTVLVVDPGWPQEVLQAVLYYRAGLKPEAVTDVFVTHVDPAHLRGLGLFSKARWLAYAEEILYAKTELVADSALGPVIRKLVKAPDKIAPGIDIFPTPGHSPGHTSLMVYTALETTFVAGDAVLTRDHLEHGDLGSTLYDRDKAEDSFREVLEIGDFVVPGHDNIVWLRSTPGMV